MKNTFKKNLIKVKYAKKKEKSKKNQKREKGKIS